MANADIEARRAEFFQNVWNHSEDPFQMQFDARRPLTKDELALLKNALSAVDATSSDVELGQKIFKLVNGTPENLALLLQLCGLTRNKIITDLKAVAASKKNLIGFPANYKALASSQTGWTLAGPYLALKLRRVFSPLTPASLTAC
jgi:hypothetical protein